MCSHPRLWLLTEGLARQSQKQKAVSMRGATGLQEIGAKKYHDLVNRVIVIAGCHLQVIIKKITKIPCILFVLLDLCLWMKSPLNEPSWNEPFMDEKCAYHLHMKNKLRCV